MDGCRAKRRLLMQYLDHELDAGKTLAFESHLKECGECSSFVERNRALEELLEATLSPALDSEKSDGFLKSVRERLPAAKERPSPRRRGFSLPAFRKLSIAAAAAVLLVVCVFHLLPGGKDEKEPTAIVKGAAPVEPDGQAMPPLPPPPARSEEELAARDAAREELGKILAELDGFPDDELAARFAESTLSLRKRGWRTNNMLSGALRREKGPALRTAVRLVGTIGGSEKLYDVIPSLSRFLQEGILPRETLKTLAALGGPRAEALVGDALHDPALRDDALGHLSSAAGDGFAREITKAVLDERDLAQGKLSSFASKAVGVLGRMGTGGLDGIVKIYERSGESPGVVRALSPPPAALVESFVESFSSRRTASVRSRLRLAAGLRLKETLCFMRPGAGKIDLDEESPSLIAAVGGWEAAYELVDLYQGPVSMRERKRLSQAFVEMLGLYPDEIDETLGGALFFLGAGDGHEALLEMLSKAPGAESCRALAWVVENRSDLSSRAALELARIGSRDALQELMSLLDSGSLARDAEASALAAAFYIGGDEVLRRLLEEGKDRFDLFPREAYTRSGTALPSRRGFLTDSRFMNLRKYFARNLNS